MTENTPSSKLEETLSTLGQNDEQSIRKALRAFVQSRVFVKLDQPWDGKTLPRSDMRLLLVTDGDNKEQSMLAVFTSARRSSIYKEEDMGPFKYIAEVDSAWACLGVPENTGIMVNPNSAPSFRISPAVAKILRETAEKDLAAKTTKPSA
ncbi:MAG: SseB family protein [Gammaproteobacteria bacterium]